MILNTLERREYLLINYTKQIHAIIPDENYILFTTKVITQILSSTV